MRRRRNERRGSFKEKWYEKRRKVGSRLDVKYFGVSPLVAEKYCRGLVSSEVGLLSLAYHPTVASYKYQRPLHSQTVLLVFTLICHQFFSDLQKEISLLLDLNSHSKTLLNVEGIKSQPAFQLTTAR